VKFALRKGRPWKSIRWVLWNHTESICTKAYTKAEVRRLLSSLKMTDIQIKAVKMNLPILTDDKKGLAHFLLMRLIEPWWGWNLLISARKS
jgi:hypothetical protein